MIWQNIKRMFAKPTATGIDDDLMDILQALERNRGYFPQDAVRRAVARREDITPHLLRILEDMAARAEDLVKEDKEPYFAHIYAMYLLALFRDTRACPLVVRLARLPLPLVDDVFGDLITADFPRILASVSGGDLAPIKALIEDKTVEEFSRGAGLHALLILVANDRLKRDEAVQYLGHLFRGGLEKEHSHAWDALATCATDLHPGELMSEIRQAFDQSLIDNGFVDLKYIEETAAKAPEDVLAELKKRGENLIDDPIGDLEGWACFHPETEQAAVDRKSDWNPAEADFHPDTFVREEPKIGRNAPCPCGSGKKYKKCCGAAA